MFLSSSRRSALAGLGVVVLALTGATGPAAGRTTAPHGPPAARAASPAGKAGPALPLQDGVQLQGYDVAVGGDGTTYIGWISSTGSAANRTVHLCAIEPDTFTCAGGVRSTPSLGPSSAAGLHLISMPGNYVVLVWFHDTDQSVSGPYNGKISTSLVQDDYSLSPAVDQDSAASFGTLLDAERTNDGLLVAVTGRTVGSGADAHTELQIHRGLGSTPGPGDGTVTLQAPVLVGKARLAYDDAQGVLVIDRYGAIDEPVRVAVQQSALVWSSFSKVPKTWSVGGAFDLSKAPGGDRLVVPIDNAHYYPRVATWNGTKFGPLALTGDKADCAPTSHDLFYDASGRLADTSVECDEVRISDQPRAGRAATVRFGISDTPAGPEPQIGTTPRGTGWVVWGQLSAGGNALMAAPVRLPALLQADRSSDEAGHVTVVGPVNCLPAVDTTVRVKPDPARGWSVVSKHLLLDGERLRGTLRGAGLEPGSSHTLVGVATFARSGDRRTVRSAHYFGACPGPSAF